MKTRLHTPLSQGQNKRITEQLHRTNVSQLTSGRRRGAESAFGGEHFELETRLHASAVLVLGGGRAVLRDVQGLREQAANLHPGAV